MTNAGDRGSYETLRIQAETAALLVMDFQRTILDGYASDPDLLLTRTSSLISAARGAGLTVIYVVVGFREGYPEVSSRNQSFRAVRDSGRFLTGASGSEIHPAVAPQHADVIVTKHRVSAFAGTDLEIVLRARQIDTLLLAGVATSGVVLSTIRHAADADYRLFVVRDCCGDRDEEVHRVLVDKVFPRQATVTSADEMCRALASSGAE